MIQVRLEMAATIAGATTALLARHVKTPSEVVSELVVGIFAGLFIGPGTADLLRVEDPYRRLMACYVAGLVVFGIIRQIVKIRDRIGKQVSYKLLKVFFIGYDRVL